MVYAQVPMDTRFMLRRERRLAGAGLGRNARPIGERRHDVNRVALKDRFLAEAFSDVGLTLLALQPDVYFFAKDDSGRFVLCNPACARPLGADSEADVVGCKDDAF